MKTVVISDVHGRNMWKQIVMDENPDRVVFLGDYFDSFDIPGLDQIHNFKEIIEYKETSGKEVILLIGNHDYHYFPEIGNTGTSGYQSGIAPYINQVINENRHHLQMAYGFGEFLFTHAGVSPEFMDHLFGYDGWSKESVIYDLNELWKYKPLSFGFNGINNYGDDTYQTPIWIRPRSLMAINQKHDKSLKKDYIQVVGHTVVQRIDTKGGSTGGRYYFVDTQDTSKQYMIITDDKITFGISE